ncbi:MAG: hypothetical protein ACR2IK_20455 [Chloroflexota bacterium]
MAVDPGYEVLGSRREQVQQLGNGVTLPPLSFYSARSPNPWSLPQADRCLADVAAARLRRAGDRLLLGRR